MHAMSSSPARQQGVAIVLAMAVVALAAVTASAMLLQQATWSRILQLTGSHAQAAQLLQAGRGWSSALLGYDARSSDIDYQGEPWAMRLPPVPVENALLDGYIEDQQGKFNVNNLLQDGKISLPQHTNFQRLLVTLALPPGLADALADWIDSDSKTQPPDGAEDDYYLALPQPYLTANQPILCMDELALVRGFDHNVRQRLQPFITALPAANTPVNMNTATAEVMSSVLEGLRLEEARAIVARRDRSFYRSLTDFTAQLPRGISVPAGSVSVSSQYFIARMTVTLEEARGSGSALLERGSDGWPRIIWQKSL